jgi:hypothetical protein
MAQLPTGPLHVTADQWNELKEHYDQGEPDDWDDAILAEELGLDEPRCPECGHPSTGLCYDCQPDQHLEAAYDEANGDIEPF